MIAEPGVLSTSPWNSDVLLKDFSSDFIKTYLNTNEGLDGFPILDIESDRTRSSRGDRIPGFSSSGSPSSASSDCSEDLSLDFICSSGNNVLHIPDHDYLNTSLNLLDEDSMSVCPQDFDWVVGDNFVSTNSLLCDDSYCERLPACFGSPIPRQKRANPPDPVMDNKLWSKMTLEEQLEAVEGLTNVISKELGLREQLDIIRIIEPTAIVSPTDTEFVIDLTSLNDQKLCQVREYVRKVVGSSELAKSGGSQLNSGKCSSSSVDANSSSCTSKSEGMSNTSKGKSVKKEAKERRTPQKVFRQRQKKEHRQLMKERRSGLFVREEVLSLSVNPVIDDTDIDILG